VLSLECVYTAVFYVHICCFMTAEVVSWWYLAIFGILPYCAVWDFLDHMHCVLQSTVVLVVVVVIVFTSLLYPVVNVGRV